MGLSSPVVASDLTFITGASASYFAEQVGEMVIYQTETEESFMSDAYIIETSTMTAGIVAAQESGFRFYASHPAMFALEGRIFNNLKDAQRAAENLAYSLESQTATQPKKVSKWGYPRVNLEKLEAMAG